MRSAGPGRSSRRAPPRPARPRRSSSSPGPSWAGRTRRRSPPRPTSRRRGGSSSAPGRAATTARAASTASWRRPTSSGTADSTATPPRSTAN
ncbi:MAG: CRISPR-associated protein Cas5 [Planctomycetes bacterium]|nr:CRISPR-associated protein Cas5 [Planctomycetota bacterium]